AFVIAISVPAVFVGAVVAELFGISGGKNGSSIYFHLGTLVLMPLFMLRDGFDGAFIGKRMMGFRVKDEETGKPIGFKKSFLRNLILYIPLSSIIMQLSLFNGRRIGDRYAKTRVMDDRYSKPT